MSAPLLTLDGLGARYSLRPECLLEVVDDIAARLVASERALVPASLVAAARDLLRRYPDPSALPLWGVPYVVGANVDVLGLPTSIGLPALDYQPDFDAIIIERLKEAGALLVGKVPVDPLGADVLTTGIDEPVAQGIAAFGIAFDRIGTLSVCGGQVVLKASRGAISSEGTFGVAPEVDDAIIVAADVGGVTAVRRVVEEAGAVARPTIAPRRLGLLGEGSSGAARRIADQLGLAMVVVESRSFADMATLMDDDAWVALRLDDVAIAFAELPDLFPPHLRRRFSGALARPTGDFIHKQHHLAGLSRRIDATLATVDLLYVPSGSELMGFIDGCGLAAILLPDGSALIGAAASGDYLSDVASTLTIPTNQRSTRPIDIQASSPLAHR